MQAPADLTQVLRRALAAHAAGDLRQAAWSCRLILAAKKNQFDALHLLGVVEFQQGQLKEALRLIQKAIKINPKSAAALLNAGLVLAALEGPAAALPYLDRALKISPNDPLAHNNRGNALWRLGRHEEALVSLEKALALAPDYGDALANRGSVLCSLRRFEEALASFDRSLALNPRDAMTWHNRGNALWELKRADDALTSYDRSLSIKADDILVLMDLGRMLQKLERYEQALATFDKVLKLAPDHLPALNTRGNALWRLKRLDEALASYDRFLAIQPDDPEVLMNRGNALGELGQFDEAIASFDKSLASRPEYPDTHWNRSLVRLRLGDFEGGWQDYEWRFKKEDTIPRVRKFLQPRWHGHESLAGKTILLHAEQGLGDTIQFACYATLVAERGATVILLVQKDLKGILSSLEGVSRIIALDEDLPQFDCHCPLLSLPLELEIRLESLPRMAPYLSAPPDSIDRWNNRLPRSGNKRVAIAWAGSTTFIDDHNRSVGLQRFSSLLAVPGIDFFSIQKALRPGDDEILKRHPNVLHLGDEIADFGDTAAIMSLMDLVVSSDTSIVHLAGALGIPVWILLQYAADWRWLLDREDCPWYPTARLFRQPNIGDWTNVLNKVSSELARFGRMSG